MIDKFLHRHLGVPYTLHVQYLQRTKRPRATLLFLHGIGSSGAEWAEVIKLLPRDVTIITVDMLGFGRSPKPEWAKYSANEQVRSIIATLVKLRISRRLIVVGHSLGGLVAVEIAKRYPIIVKSLVLCSPPFYNHDEPTRLPRGDQVLKMLYGRVEYNQASFVRLSQFAIKHKLVNEAFSVTAATLPVYLQTLKSSIISQSAFRDAMTIKRPITIVYGTLDPFIIVRNLKMIHKNNPNVTLRKALAGHEIMGKFVSTIAMSIQEHIDTTMRDEKP